MTATQIASTLYAAQIAFNNDHSDYAMDIYSEALPFLNDNNRQQVASVLKRIYKCEIEVLSSNI
ncbi:MAG: hypothetical protein ACRCZS_23775 [Chroococcidiopsis sp.]